MCERNPGSLFAPVLVRTGDILTMDFAVSGLRTYLAVYGGIRVPSGMGSRSTNLKCRMGGLEVKGAPEGDRLESGKSHGNFKKISKKLKEMRSCYPWREIPWLRRSSTPYRFTK